jgi:hypothetical protein
LNVRLSHHLSIMHRDATARLISTRHRVTPPQAWETYPTIAVTFLLGCAYRC